MPFLSKFYEEKRDWFKYIYSRLNASVGGHYYHNPEEAADEVFINALTVLGEKYSTLEDEVIARRTLVSIIRYEVFNFRKCEKDNYWLDHYTEEERAGQAPPSVRWHTEYMRAYRKKHPEKQKKADKRYFAAHKDEIYARRKKKRLLIGLFEYQNGLVDANGLPVGNVLSKSLIGLPTSSPEDQLVVEDETELLADTHRVAVEMPQSTVFVPEVAHNHDEEGARL